MKTIDKLFLVSFVIISFTYPLTGQQLYNLPPFDVNTDEWHTEMFDGEIAGLLPTDPSNPTFSMSELLEEVPGMVLQRRGIGSMEPNLRGFTMDRVSTSFNGHYLPIGSPTHTASPANYLGPVYFGNVRVMSGFGSVASGPVPTGGRIEVESYVNDIRRDFIQVSGMSNPGGYIGGLVASPFSEGSRLKSLISLYSSHAGEYDSGEGLAVVDEDYAAWGVTSSFMVNPLDDASLDFSINYQSQERANNPSLPLDSIGSEALFLTTDWTQNLTDGQFVWRFGYAEINNGLSSENRLIVAAAPVELIEADADANSCSSGIAYSRFLKGDILLKVGLDHVSQTRDASRQRHLKSGDVLNDQVWPDILVNQTGGFLELTGGNTRNFQWRIGARIELTRMNANKLESPVVGVPGSSGSTIGENFSAFHGSDPVDVQKEDWTGSLQAIFKKKVLENLEFIAGLEYTVAPPGPGESYRAFLNALGGGVELGNPNLDTENKRNLSLGIHYRTERFRFTSEVWFAEISDFVQREIIITNPLIYSFKNRDSRFRGGDMSLWIRPFEDDTFSSLTLELSHSRTWGKTKNSGLSLPDVPPRETRLAIKWNDNFDTGTVSCTMNLRHAGRQSNPQPSLNPIYHDTDSFFILDLGLRMKVLEKGRLYLGIINILDELAYAYLQPPVTTGPVQPSGGNLSTGDRIPLPGRSFSCSFTWNF